ncbi:hypothetical protein FRC07_014223 [Ceratobasidium sp. 392]|nr:hypothetical protein FRC07_014223 [Ceratobasidium sp. 392]
MSASIKNILNTPAAFIVGRKRSASSVSNDECPAYKKRFVYPPSDESSFDSLSTITDSDIKTETDNSYFELSASPEQIDSPYFWHWLPPYEGQVTAAPQYSNDEPGYFTSPPGAKVGLGLGPIVKPKKKRGIYGDKPRRPSSQPRKIPYPIRGFSTSSPILPSSPVAKLRYPSDKLEYPNLSANPPTPVITSPLPGALDLMARCLVYSFTSWEVPPLPVDRTASPDPSLHLPPIILPSLTLPAAQYEA